MVVNCTFYGIVWVLVLLISLVCWYAGIDGGGGKGKVVPDMADIDMLGSMMGCKMEGRTDVAGVGMLGMPGCRGGG